eukprot:CAMPEP_0201541488 /NCGR_PEP_ID=MMETSP0161_2-20130828/71507_1 /ASSEMBLY_ACC=CAM_ASM_000251 /TAXON_ID=180227 /ORGANISM="Neoparamoeba aestuarina, Strain SoJaBio B1-5/56/2" /LENGTH=65 /DNA_ID=CAMNT_0047949031 /DNA_START=387 /DNA_END=584 /DNA_ORIENTATION=+
MRVRGREKGEKGPPRGGERGGGRKVEKGREPFLCFVRDKKWENLVWEKTQGDARGCGGQGSPLIL